MASGPAEQKENVFMEQQPAKKRRGPASKLGKILINLIVTAVVGFLYFLSLIHI